MEENSLTHFPSSPSWGENGEFSGLRARKTRDNEEKKGLFPPQGGAEGIEFFLLVETLQFAEP